MLVDFVLILPWTLAYTLALPCAIILWRTWAFTIRPRLFPSEPKKIPYWIPFLGNAMSFFNDSYGLVCRGRSLAVEHEPYTLTVPGQELYIVTSPKDVAAVYRNIATFSWHDFVDDLMLKFGVNPSALPKVWAEPVPGTSRHRNPLNPKHESLVHYSEGLYRDQLLQRPGLDTFSDKLLDLVNKTLSWKELPARYTVAPEPILLMDFCANIMVSATTCALFDELIYAIEPDLTHMVVDFTEEAWKMLMFPYPMFAARKLYKARDGIYQSLVKYIRHPQELRANESWLMREILMEQEAAEIDDENKAAITFMLFWAANLNVYRISTWILSYILSDPSLLQSVQAVSRLAFDGGTPKYEKIYDDPLMSSIWDETLRFTFGSVSVRKVAEPTVVGGKTLKTGNTVLIPIRQLHYNAEVFGEDSDRFNGERFLRNKELSRHPSYRPFAGGITFCPGRFRAKRAVLFFVATVLYRFEIEVVTKEGRPRQMRQPPLIDHVSPNLGIMSPVKGTEFYVKLRSRSGYKKGS